MLTANSNDKKNTFRVAFLTIMSIFITGYLNALALNTYELASMITPQTGNIIWMGIFAASGYWGYFFETIGLFIGFMGGAVFALYTQNLFENKRVQFFWNWTVFVLPIMLYPTLFQYLVHPVISFTLLGFSAGATLGFFRKVYHIEINTSMATGNVRFLGLHFAQAFLKKKPTKEEQVLEIRTFWIFFAAVFAFAFGAFMYVIFARVDALLALDFNLTLGYYYGSPERLSLGMLDIWHYRYEMYRPPVGSTNFMRIGGLLLLCIIPYFFCPKYKKE